jgi:uncharacterized membrane protein
LRGPALPPPPQGRNGLSITGAEAVCLRTRGGKRVMDSVERFFVTMTVVGFLGLVAVVVWMWLS